MEKTFRSLCRRWVNPAVADEAEIALQGGLFVFLFALPPLTLATALLALITGTPPDGALAALAVSLPVLASSSLSLSGSQRVRNLVIMAGGPMFVLSVSASTPAVIAAASIAFIAGSVRFWHRQSNWKFWLASGIAALLLAMAMLATSPVVVGPMSLLAAMPVMLLAGICGGVARRLENMPPVANETVDVHPQLAALADHAGSLVFRIEKNGFVSRSHGRTPVETLTPAVLRGRGLVEKLHIADRPGFLAWIGGLTTGSVTGVYEARLSATGEHGVGQWFNGQFKCLHEDAAGLMLSLVVVAANNGSDNENKAVAIGSLGHELRTPLNAIVGFSELLTGGYCGPLANEKQAEYIDLIHRSSRHLLQVSDTMLDWSQLESGTRRLDGENFEPADVATLAIGIVSADAKAKGVGLDFNPACGLDEFCGDKRALTQILVNLLSNAIKFAPENGLVSLALDFDKERLVVSVSDNGPGISAEDQTRIGTPFLHSQTTAGNGLGLSIVRQLTRLHSGSLQVESGPGEGTCVKVALSSLRPHRSNVSQLRPVNKDESSRDIQIFGEFGHAKTSKTA